jgi:hypothetical protein
LKPYFFFFLTAVFLYAGIELCLIFDLISIRPTYALETILFFMALNMVIYRNVVRFSTSSGDLIRIYLLSIVLKLVTGLGFLVTIILLDRDGASGNGVLFLICYLVFTLGEITLLLKLKNS